MLLLHVCLDLFGRLGVRGRYRYFVVQNVLFDLGLLMLKQTQRADWNLLDFLG